MTRKGQVLPDAKNVLKNLVLDFEWIIHALEG